MGRSISHNGSGALTLHCALDGSREGACIVVRGFVLWLVLYGLWLVQSGKYSLFLVTVGGVGSALIVLFTAHLRLLDTEGQPLELGLRFLRYWAWLGAEIAKANWAVARIILSPRLSIDPGVVTFASTQHSDLGRVIFANSITLTPGTVTLSVEPGAMVVHALTPAFADAAAGAAMDARVTRLERVEAKG